MTALSPIKDIVADIRDGRMVVLVDEEDGENEGDLVRAAECVTPEAIHLANLVQICCERVQSAVVLLSSMKNANEILKISEDIDGLESDADRVMRAAISKLFRDERDDRQLIKLKAVYELLEATTDKCQDVANVIEGVVLENG